MESIPTVLGRDEHRSPFSDRTANPVSQPRRRREAEASSWFFPVPPSPFSSRLSGCPPRPRAVIVVAVRVVGQGREVKR